MRRCFCLFLFLVTSWIIGLQCIVVRRFICKILLFEVCGDFKLCGLIVYTVFSYKYLLCASKSHTLSVMSTCSVYVHEFKSTHEPCLGEKEKWEMWVWPFLPAALPGWVCFEAIFLRSPRLEQLCVPGDWTFLNISWLSLSVVTIFALKSIVSGLV